MEIIKPAKKAPPKLATIDKELQREDIRNKMEFYRVNGLKVGVAMVNCDLNILENVAAYASYVEELTGLGNEILGINSQMVQMGVVDKRVLTQFVITYRLPSLLD